MLQKRVDHANPASLAAIRAEVAASVAATQSFVQQVQQGAAVQAGQAGLSQASEAARGSVADFLHAYYDEHKFDRYLQFASLQDEDEYRKREEDRHRAIEKAMADHTPQGDLKALDLSVEQLKDAGAHGAEKSPEYQSTLDGFTKRRADLQKALAPQPDTSTKQAQKDSAPDPAATLKAAGVSLASETDATKAAPRDGSARVRT